MRQIYFKQSLSNILVFTFLLFAFMLHGQESISFEAVNNEKGILVKSCIPMEDYDKDLATPYNNSSKVGNRRVFNSSSKYLVLNSKWVDDCLHIQFNSEEKTDSIINLISEITIYNSSLISINRAK